MKLSISRRAAVVGLLGALSLFLAGCDSSPAGAPSFKGIDITGNKVYSHDFHLTDHNGVPRSLADYKGKVVTLFFGFMNCPDFCPTHLARQNEVLKLLGEKDAARVQTLMLTVDPERDTPDLLRQYVTAFNPSFIGLTGSKAEIDAVVAAYRGSYQHVPLKDSALGYTVNHSTLTMVFDPEGRIRLALRHELSAEDVAHDVRLLLK